MSSSNEVALLGSCYQGEWRYALHQLQGKAWRISQYFIYIVHQIALFPDTILPSHPVSFLLPIHWPSERVTARDESVHAFRVAFDPSISPPANAIHRKSNDAFYMRILLFLSPSVLSPE